MSVETRSVSVSDLLHDRQVGITLAALRDPNCAIPWQHRRQLILWAETIRLTLLREARAAQKLWDEGEKLQALSHYSAIFSRLPQEDRSQFRDMNPYVSARRPRHACL